MFAVYIQMGLAVILAVGSFILEAKEDKLQQVLKEQGQNHKAGRQSQKKVTVFAEQTQDLKTRHRMTLSRIANTREYNQQLKVLIADQKKEKLSIREQITEVKKTRKEIAPLLQEMLDTLEQFIAQDVPFLKKERQERLKKIKSIMNKANITVSEKYRKIMTAYQTENEYGKTIEAYEGVQDIDGKSVNVNFLRLGRVVFIYQTLDRKKQAYWDQGQRKWQKLPSRYNRAVEEGLLTARKLIAPQLLSLPVPAGESL